MIKKRDYNISSSSEWKKKLGRIGTLLWRHKRGRLYDRRPFVRHSVHNAGHERIRPSSDYTIARESTCHVSNLRMIRIKSSGRFQKLSRGTGF